jgi:hypothetical protein
MQNNYKNLDFSAFEQSKNVSIESYFMRATQLHKLNDPEFQTLNLEGHSAALCAIDAALGHCKKWLLEVRKRPQVASYFTKTIQTQDVTVNLGSVKIGAETIRPLCGSLDPVFKEAQPIYAREVANILTLHTTHKTSLDEWITVDKAAEIGIPYINCTLARQLLNVKGNDNFITRDAIYAKLVGDLPGDWCLLIFCMSIIYDSPSLKEFTEVSESMLEYYKENKPKGYPSIKGVRIPKLTTPLFRYPTSTNSIWYLSIKSGQILGDVRKRGVISCGYYRFDMPSSEIKLIEEATDIIMICRRFKYGAVRTNTLNQTLCSILVKNGISVYTTHSSYAQPGKKAGIWGHGTMKAFTWGIYQQTPPKLVGDTPDRPLPILAKGRNESFFNYVYIPDTHDSCLVYLPSVAAATGLCIATNTKVQGVTCSDLLKRFCRAQIFRNMFPYTRLTFVNQDTMRDWFNTSWVFPKKTDKKTSDIFMGAVEESIAYDESNDDFNVIGMIRSKPPKPTPEQKGVQNLLEILNNYNDEALQFFLKKVEEGAVEMEEPTITEIYASISQEDFCSIITNELRSRRKKKMGSDPSSKPQIDSPPPEKEPELPTGPPEKKPTFNPFAAGFKQSKFALYDESAKPPQETINSPPPPPPGGGSGGTGTQEMFSPI